MAPSKPREPSIERTSEYAEFIDKLAEYHDKRGTILEREPKVGSRHIDLLRLYKRVVEEGGYDKVSDTRGNKLAWRRIASEFLPGSSTLTTQAFIFKSTYYKNLA
jgi:chromatin structure-remodeling complex subunit RSC9